MKEKRDPIAEYYERERERLSEANKALQDAIARGAPPKVIQRLRDYRDRVADVGD